MKRFTEKRYLIHKRIITTVLSLIMTLTLSVPCMPAVPVHASEIEWTTISDKTTNSDLKDLAWRVISDVVGFPGLSTVAKNYYSSISSTTSNRNPITNINKNNYYYRGDSPITNNTTNYKVFNDYTKVQNTQNNYKYSFYNPVTKTYNYTNTFKYNTTNNIYNYTTTNVTNNYTTNYYVQDNSTYVSYYIIEEDTSARATFEAYYEIYFELPDGRNSYTLKKEDIWGQYFIYNYSKYQSVPEDDGKTLGLWHLDGNLKDSSYNGNTSGSSYSTTYKDADFDGGKYLSTSFNDFLQLNINKVSLPSSWTLEWIQYVPDSSWEQFDLVYDPSETRHYIENPQHHIHGGNHANCEFDAVTYITKKLFKTTSIYDDSPVNSFTPFCLTCNNGNYSLFVNGNKVDSSKFSLEKSGITVDNNKIKFICAQYLNNTEEYGSKVSSGNWSYYYPEEGSNLARIMGCGKGVYVGIPYNRYRNQYYYNVNCDTIIDEVRLSKGILHTGNYTPSNQAYTTNTVLVVPTNPKENEISFKTNYKLGNVRIGGARPTYPTTGDIFVNIEDDKVDSIQQYQETGWYSITGAIYRNGKWSNLKDFNMKEYAVKEPCHCDTLCTSDSINKDCSACSDDWKQCIGKPVCICGDRCESGSVNNKCPVCSEDWGNCTGTPVCHCEIQCTSDSVNHYCIACNLDWTHCTGTPVCHCEVRCTSDSIDNNCPVCSEDWKHCAGISSAWPACNCDVRCTSDSVNYKCPLCGISLDNGIEIVNSDVLNMIRSRKFDKGTFYTLSSSVAQSNSSAVFLSSDTDMRKYFDPAFLETKKFYTSSSEKDSASHIQRYYGLDTASEYLNDCDSVFDSTVLKFDFPNTSISFIDGYFNYWMYGSKRVTDFYYNSAYKTLCINMGKYELYVIYDGSFFIFCELPPVGSYDISEKIHYRAYQLSDGTSSYFINHAIYDTDLSFEYCIGTPPAPPECNCDSRCTADSVNNDCPVCSGDWEKCTGTPPAPPECNCDSRCTADSVNNNCPVCSDDWAHCTGTPSVSHVCWCITQCTADSVNHDCELCNDDWSQCTGTPSADPVCNCDVLCTSDSVDNNCPVCSDDWKQCTGISDIPGPDNPDPDGPNPDDIGDKETIWDKLGKVFSGLFGIIEKLISPFIDGIVSLINTIITALGSLTNLSGAFGDFLKASFVFIPEDILSIIGLGVMLTILASIIKIFM